jgi:hypothetical protein
MHLIQLLLPLADNEGRPFDATVLAALRRDLAERFGGLTAYTRAPAEGVWAHDGKRDRDDIVVVEVMTENLDRGWWKGLRLRLERDLRQQSILIRCHEVEVL